jgi:hypothetical protein
MPRATHIRPTKADLDRLAKAAASHSVEMREEFISADGSKIVVTAGKLDESRVLLSGSDNPWDEVFDNATHKERAS